MMRNKRGTHVGVILSFLIFVTFLAFLYSITEPATRVSRDKLDLLEYLKVELLNKFSEDMSSVTVRIINTGSCGKFEDFGGLEELGVVVKDEAEEIVESYVELNGDTEVSSYSGLMKFYYSTQFNRGSSLGCSSLIDSSDYEISIFRTTEQIFESKIINTSESIESIPGYYEELKEELGVPFDDNFGFTFSNSTKDFITGTEEKDIGVDIYSEEIPIQYIDDKANINPGFLNIRVW